MYDFGNSSFNLYLDLPLVQLLFFEDDDDDDAENDAHTFAQSSACDDNEMC